MGVQTTTREELDAGQIHDILRNDRRRLAIKCLREMGGRLTVRDLSEEVATRETGESPAPRDKRRSVYVSLHQTHLPKMDELGIVADDDGDEKRVRLEHIETAETYVTATPDRDSRLTGAYLGVALVGFATAAAVIAGIPGVSSASATYLLAGYFGVQLVAVDYLYERRGRSRARGRLG